MTASTPSLRFTGHALVDVGIAGLVAFAEKKAPEEVSLGDLDRASQWIADHYYSGLLGTRIGDATVRIRQQATQAAEERFSREADARVRVKDEELAAAQAKVAAAASKEAELLKKQRELAEKEQQMDLAVERRLGEATTRIREQEANAARERFSREADDRVRVKQVELVDAQAKLSAVATREADLLKKQRELADRERELGVETERRVGEATAKVREQETALAQQRAEIMEEAATTPRRGAKAANHRPREDHHRADAQGAARLAADPGRGAGGRAA